jgi:hypothetical protein
MRKILMSAALSGLVASQTVAGGLAPVVVEPAPVIVEKPASSVSPLLILGLLVLIGVLVSRNNDEEEEVVVISDIRLKTDITRVGTAANGLPLYHYRYVGQSQMFEGVMAQDVLAARPDAVVDLPFGYMGVNYTKLGLTIKAVN